jgi:hypothetical protein
MSMKLAPKLTAVVVVVVAVAVAVVVVVVAVVVVAVVTAAVAVVAVAAVVTAAAVVVVGTNNPVLSKKLDSRHCSFNNSGLKENWHRITALFV